MTASNPVRAADRSKYVPPPCPDCGGTNVVVTQWRDASDMQNLDQWIATGHRCLTCYP